MRSKQLLKIFIAVALLLSLSSGIYAASVIWHSPSAGSPISTCFESKNITIPFEVLSGPLTDGILEVRLPVGVTYLPGSLTCTKLGVTYDVSSLPNAPRFLLGNVASLENITISFGQNVACGTTVGTVSDTVVLFDNTTQINPTTSVAFDIGAASLSINNVVNFPVTASSNQTVLRTVDIANQAVTGFVKEFYYREKYPAGAYVFDTNSFRINPAGINYTVSPTYISISATNDTLIVQFDTTLIRQIGDLDSLFETESFQLSYSFYPVGCDPIASTGSVYWGCGGDICQLASRVIDQSVTIGSPPTLQLKGGGIIPKICLGSANTYTASIVNSSSAATTNVNVKIYSFNSYLLYHDTATVFYKKGVNGTLIHPAFTNIQYQSDATLNASTNCNYNGKPYSFTFSVTAIAPGDTILISYDTYYCSFNNYASSDPTQIGKNVSQTLMDVSYNDFCGNTYPTQTANVAGYSNWTFRDILNNPGDIFAGQTLPFVTIVTTENYANVNTVYNRPDAYYEVTMVLPPGIEFDDSGGDGVKWYNSTQTTDWPNTAITVNTTTVNATNTVTVTFPAADVISTVFSELIFKLKGVDYSDSVGGSCGEKEILQYIRFIPDPGLACASSSPLNVAFNSYDVFLHCDDDTCDGTVLYDFSLERTSYGLPDNDENGLPDASGSLDLNKIRTERIMYGDTITATYKAIISTLSGVVTSFSNVYATLYVPQSSYYSIVSKTATIKKNGGGIVTGTLTSSSVNDTTTFDLSPLGVTSYEQGDSIQVDILLKLTTNIGGSILAKKFTANMYASTVPSPPGSRYACNISYGKTLNLLGYYFTNGQGGGGNNVGNTLTFSDCQDKKFSLNYYLSVGPCCGNYNGGNLFPFEVRRWAFLDSVQLTVPAGYSIVASSAVTNFRTAGTNGTAVEPTIGTLNPVRVSGNQYTYFYGDTYIQNGGTYLNVSDDGWYLNHIYTIRPSSAVVQNTNGTFNVKSYSKSTGQIVPATDLRNSNFTLYYNGPKQLSTSPIVSTINATTDSVIWTADIENLTPPIPSRDTWLYFKSRSGLINIQRVKVDGVVYTPNANGFYELGTFSAASATSLEIKSIYRSCGDDSILMYMGYNCFLGYPENLDGANIALAKDSTYFYVIPQPAQITANILSPDQTPLHPATPADGILYGVDSVIMCSIFPVEIQLNNAQPSVLSNVQTVLSLPTKAGLPGVTFLSGSGYIEYPEGTTPRAFSAAANTALTTPPGKISLTFDLAQIDPLNFGFTGLTGTTDLTKNKVRLRFELETNCNLQSGSRFKTLNKAKAPCGAGAIGNNTLVFSEKLNVVGAERSYIADVILNITGTEFTSCTDPLPGTMSITKSGDKPVQLTDSVYITFPSALDIDGSIFCTGTPCSAATVTFSNIVVGTQRIISWPVPQSFNALADNGNGETANYTFNIKLVTISSITPSIADVIAQVVESAVIYCDSIPCPSSGILLGEDEVNSLLINFPLIGAGKHASTPVKQVDDSYNVTYSIVVRNYGSVDLDHVKLVDSLINTFPPPTTFSISSVQATGSLIADPLYNGSTNLHVLDSSLSTLAAGEADTITFLVNVLPGINLGPFYNTAFAYGRDTADCSYWDESTDGFNPDPDDNGNPSDTLENVPTPVSFRPVVIGVAKTDTVTAIPDGTYDVLFSIIVKNYGTDNLNNVQLLEDLSAVITPPATFAIVPSPVATGSLTINPSFNGTTDKFLLDSTQSTLAVDDADTITFTMKITPNGYYGPFYNTIIGKAIGVVVGETSSDTSHNGYDPDPDGDFNPNEDGENDPTPIILHKPIIGVAKSDTTILGPNETYDVTINIFVKNYGNDTLLNVQVSENLDSTIVPPSTYTLVSSPVATGNLTTNTAFDGSTNYLLLDSTLSMLATNDADSISFTIRVTPNGYYGPFYNSVIATAIGLNSEGATSDTSHSGSEPDPDGDKDPNEPGENDSTIIFLTDFLAIDDSNVICEDSLITGDVSLNDLFPGVVIYRLLSSPSSGLTLLKTAGTYTFTPVAGFAGTDKFTYVMCDNGTPQRCDTAVVTITINPLNRKPIAVTDKKHLEINNNAAYIDIQINDSAPDTGQTLTTTATIISGPYHGTATVINADSIQYQPEENYCGKDTLFYEICDDGHLQPCGVMFCDTGMVVINITPTMQDSTCELPPNLPKGFSPNGDGQNDVLSVLGGPFQEMNLKIFNNWGEVIFESNIQSLGWDGKRDGIAQAQGVYIATLSVVMQDTKLEYKITQDITLFR